MSFLNKLFKKKKTYDVELEPVEEVSKKELITEETTFTADGVGELTLGYNEKENIVVNLVSKSKYKKSFKVGGVQDEERKNNWKGWLYLAPVLILMSVFLIYPLINTICIAFMENYNQITSTSDGFTFDNFLYVLGIKPIQEATETTSAVYITSVVQYALPNTFFIVFVTVPISIALSLIISVLLNNLRWFQKIYQTVFFLPYVTNTIAVGMVFSVIFDKNGVINWLFGLDSSTVWIYGASRWMAMVPLCTYIIWGDLPFKILILLSGLQNVDKQYYQAAKIDAAPQWKVLTRITVPALMPQILYLSVTSFIGAFKEYSSVVGLFGSYGGGTSADNSYVLTVVYYIYENIITHTSRAAAVAVILFVIILIFTVFQLALNKRRARN